MANTKKTANTNVSITFREGVNIEEIHKAVQQVVVANMNGCRTCGLAGIDLRLAAVHDPEPYLALQTEEIRSHADVLQVAVAGPVPTPW